MAAAGGNGNLPLKSPIIADSFSLLLPNGNIGRGFDASKAR